MHRLRQGAWAGGLPGKSWPLGRLAPVTAVAHTDITFGTGTEQYAIAATNALKMVGERLVRDASKWLNTHFDSKVRRAGARIFLSDKRHLDNYSRSPYSTPPPCGSSHRGWSPSVYGLCHMPPSMSYHHDSRFSTTALQSLIRVLRGGDGGLLIYLRAVVTLLIRRV